MINNNKKTGVSVLNLKRIKVILLFLLLSTEVISQNYFVRIESLPWEAQKVLNKEFKYWDYFNSAVPFFDSLGKHTAWEYKDLIKGDFNDDEQIDYAVLVKPYDEKEGYLVVLFKNNDNYKMERIKKIQYFRDYVLYLSKKGNEVYNFEKDTYTNLEVDAIVLNIFERCGTTYYWSGKSFIGIYSSD